MPHHNDGYAKLLLIFSKLQLIEDNWSILSKITTTLLIFIFVLEQQIHL